MLKVVNRLCKNGRTRRHVSTNILRTDLWNNGVTEKQSSNTFDLFDECYGVNKVPKNGTEVRVRVRVNGSQHVCTSSTMSLASNNLVKCVEKYQERSNINKNKSRSLKLRNENDTNKINWFEKNVCYQNTFEGVLKNEKFLKKINCLHQMKIHFNSTANIYSDVDKKNSNEKNMKMEMEKKEKREKEEEEGAEKENQENVEYNMTTGTKQKTKKELHIDKQYKEKLIKMYLLLSFLLIPSGYFLMTCMQKNITYEDLIKMGKQMAEQLENKCTEKMNDFIEKYFPLSNEPLLPDFKDLNYPEHLPTLVVDLNYVIAKLEYDRKVGWRVLKRPYADLFFKELASFYEIVIWSDDNFPVAQDVVSKWGIPAIGCLHRDQCIKKKKSYVKDLKRLGRNIDRVVIIDHDPNAFMLQPANGILIKEFNGNVNDKELLCLIDFLKAFAITTTDISSMLKKYGGGDYDIGRRYLQLKSDKEEKSRRIRNFGKIFNVDGRKSSNGVFNS